ncbi:MAG: hypothetical protein JW794_06770 [Candidatus Cloacimonetes bacterium]|nr:hypothetical protein [Candidatus Cloacimonadota bacterium]
MDILDKQIQEFLQDRSSGSQALAASALEIIYHLFESGNNDARIMNFLEKAVERFSEMAAIIKLKEHFSDGITADKIKEFDDLLNNKTYIKNSSYLFDKPKKIVTFSRSTAVEEVILHYKDMISEVICCHSLPLGEGKAFSIDLQEQGVSSLLIEDAELSSILPEADFMLIGADAITEKIFINKVGTLQAVLLAHYLKKEVYVVSSSLKKITAQNFPAEKHGHYFEEIHKTFVTNFIY